MTPADIAADIRRVSPGALPESFQFDHLGRPCSLTPIEDVHDSGDTDWGGSTHIYNPVTDDIAEAVLGWAMVEDQHLTRGDGYWCIKGERGFHDADHGGSLGAAYAAWRWARGIA